MRGTKYKILALLKQSKAIVSGASLAKELNVSRTAIWKSVRDLEKLGYQIEHLANGYRFLSSNVLEAEEIAFYPLSAENIFIEKQIDSTMNAAKVAGMNHQATPALFLTETQTGGRGRYGRPFFSPEGQIYMTLLLEPNRTFEELPQYTLLTAVAVASAIDEVTGKTCSIKWVNDIFLDGKKVCGILSEAMSDFETGQISHVTIGIGLNFAIQNEQLPNELQAIATSLFSEVAPTITRNELIQKIWRNFFELLDGLPDTTYLDYYRNKSFVIGKVVSFTQRGITYSGKTLRISDAGELIVQTTAGEMTLSSGEISLSTIDGKQLK